VGTGVAIVESGVAAMKPELRVGEAINPDLTNYPVPRVLLITEEVKVTDQSIPGPL